jgi:microcystin-dependent protein
MSDWNLPGLDDHYVDYLQKLKDRDYDAISLGITAITNPVAGMMRYVRATNKFQEYDGVNWVDKVLSVAGGGTGTTTPGGISGILGLGTMANQNANNVSISGGGIVGLGSLQVNGATALSGSLDVAGGAQFGSGNVNLIGADGKIPAINNTYFASLDGSAITGIISFVAGMIMPFGGPNVPAGWHPCNGSAISRTTYAALFAAIGGYYGVGDGVNTFNLPNLQGRMPIGYGQGGGLTNRAFAEVGGQESVALTTPQLPSHFHDITDPGHGHTLLTNNIGGGVEQGAVRYDNPAPGAVVRDINEKGTRIVGYATSNINATNGAGGDQAHLNMQPYIAMHFIIKY